MKNDAKKKKILQWPAQFFFSETAKEPSAKETTG